MSCDPVFQHLKPISAKAFEVCRHSKPSSLLTMHIRTISNMWTIYYYNIAFVNSERWLAKSRVDITLCQHGEFPATFLLRFFVLYYKRNIKHFFRIDIQLYQHLWKLEKLEIMWKHSALRASCFHTISRFSNFHSCRYNCI